ncbi:MAG: glycine C-acetyltransferase [Xanthomonadales bacterium]|nr:glycine C-acetyltransferase [Gammaproteobacteria bacterium]MBT8051312.1 glycine C-acetyltransferase [Gammaproteobacteria bacterium]MBT8056570.1 glycine C-acetyltransferase [Gammaproteobacteria bacterium]NNJ79853.1 glycine C-acetyltransferase [Xanthomonadales bacterium]NNL03777.1 glycine C-acetyltransferase [Xanthomonadales bacterium]
MSTQQRIQNTLKEIREAGLYKQERIITTPQGVQIRVQNGSEVLNFCANNYLGLADNPDVINAAHKALDDHGFGLASVRFICGTQDLHKQLEQTISTFFGTDDTILYTSCFDANGGFFETLLGPEDAVISDALNHASIIDGIRLCKAQRHRYPNSDMEALEKALQATRDCRTRLIATDGAFSMDGYIAKLGDITALAEKYDALVMVDDSHATGFLGPTGRGSAEHHGVMDKVDIFTSTLGKALGGGSGGFTTGRQEIIDLLRQRSRPYLFSNTLPPPLVAAGIKVFEMLSSTTELRDRLEDNTRYFRSAMTEAGFDIKEGVHPIVPVMLYDAPLAQEFAARLLEEGIYVIGFFFPVVPRGEARIRVQISAAHSREHLDRAIGAFTRVGRELGVLK